MDPRSQVSAEFAKNLKSIPNDAGLAKLADEAISNFSLNPLNKMAASERALQSLNDRLALNTPDTISDTGRETLLAIQQRLGGSNIGSRFSQLLAQAGDKSVGLSASDAIGILESEQRRLQGGQVINAPSFGTVGGGSFTTTATVEDKENAKLLGELIGVLKQQVEQAKETNRKLTDSGIPVTNN